MSNLPPRCGCGTFVVIFHACDFQKAKPLKHGERGPLGPRCPGCNTLHANIEHVCPRRDALLARDPRFTDEPATEQIALDQWRQGWRPMNMCPSCVNLQTPCKACWARAGYKAESYAGRFTKG